MTDNDWDALEPTEDDLREVELIDDDELIIDEDDRY